jgi:CubicO group peptidase (beta-lactamase class C family)
MRRTGIVALNLVSPLLTALAVAGFSACAQQGTSSQIAVARDTLAPRFARLEARFDSIRKDKRIPGMSVAVVLDGRVVYAKGFGFMDGEGQRPATPETAYWIASLTKPFTAAVLLRLWELRLLDLDRRMTDLPGYTDLCAEFAPSQSIFAKDLDCSAPLTIRQTLSHLVQGVPGKSFAYNAAVYSQLRRVAPLVSQRTWGQLMTEYVLAPAGMNNTAAGWYDQPKSHVLSNLAQPRRVLPTGGTTISITPIWDVGSGAGLISTVLDLAKFDAALNSGAIVSSATRATMFTPTTTSAGTSVPYGLGWYVQDYGGRRLVWHSGWEPNSYSALYLKVPDRRLTLIVLANSEGVWWGNALDKAEVEKSPFAAAFLELVVR